MYFVCDLFLDCLHVKNNHLIGLENSCLEKSFVLFRTHISGCLHILFGYDMNYIHSLIIFLETPRKKLLNLSEKWWHVWNLMSLRILVVLNPGQFCPSEDIWLCLEIFLVVTSGGDYYWNLEGRGQRCC